eukprot:gene12855-biopygen14742
MIISHSCTPVADANSVHWLPFSIGLDGPANVSEYFVPDSQPNAEGEGFHVRATFRGRRLKGTQRPLPDGYEGLILKPCQSAAAATDTEQRSWQALGQFQQLTVWNHDAVPASTDWHQRCLDWLLLADKVHAPVDVDQLEVELKQVQTQTEFSVQQHT